MRWKEVDFCSVSCRFEFMGKRTSRHCTVAPSCSWEQPIMWLCHSGSDAAAVAFASLGFSSVFYKISLPQPPSSCLNRAHKQSERCWIIHPLSSLLQITDLRAKTSCLICSEARRMRRAGRPLDHGLHSACASSCQADELQSALLLWLGHAAVITGDLFWRNPQTGPLTATNETSFSC